MNLNDPRLDIFFKVSLPVILLRSDTPNFTILGYNDAYKEATYTHFRDITGWYLWEAFNPHFSGGEGAIILIAALNRVIETGMKLITQEFQYNIPVDDLGTITESWWQLEIIPFFNNSGEVTELLINTNKKPSKTKLKI